MKQKQNIMLIILLIILIVIILGISYAFLQTSFFASKDNVLKVGSLSLVLDESEGNAITVSSDGPLSDEDGLKLENYYSFKLVNNGKVASTYKIYLDDQPLDDGDIRIDQKYIHYSLEKNDSSSTAKVLFEDQQIANGIINSGETIDYKLRLWFSSDMTAAEENKIFKAKLRIEGASTSEEGLNEICRAAGGDYYIDGECRKYYVMKNNFIKNADFSAGNSDWIFNSALVKSIDNGEILITCPNATSTCGIFQQPLEKVIIDHKYYASQSFKTTSSTKHMFVGIESTNYVYSDYLSNDDWYVYTYTFIYDAAMKNIVDNYYHAFVFYSIGEFDIDFSVRNPMFIDLTLMFGKGNEPSKEWCDKNLTGYIEYNESGVKTTIADINYVGKTSYYDVIDIF